MRVSPTPGVISGDRDLKEKLEKVKEAIQKNKIPAESDLDLSEHSELILYSKTREMTEYLVRERGMNIAYKDVNDNKRTLLHKIVCEPESEENIEHLRCVINLLCGDTSSKRNRSQISVMGDFILSMLYRGDSIIVESQGKPLAPRLTNGNTPLHEICQNGPDGNSSMLDQFLDEVLQMEKPEKNFALNSENEDKKTALAILSERGDVDLLDTLLDHATQEEGKASYIDVNAKDEKNWTAMHYAASLENPTIMERLIEFGGDTIKLNESNEMGRTPLLLAIKRGNTKTAKVLYERDDVLIDVKDGNDKTALEYALNNKEKNRDFLQYFTQKMFENETTLNAAIKKGHTDELWTTLETFDMNWLKNRYGKSAYEEEPPKMNENEVDLNDLRGGEGILHRAARYDNAKFIEKRIESISERNALEKQLILDHRLATNKISQSPLHIAAKHGNVDSLIKLIEYVFGLNKVKVDGKEDIDPKAWDILMAKNIFGDTFLQTAMKSRHMDPESISSIIKKIDEYEKYSLKNNLKLYQSTDNQKNTLLHNAVQRGKHPCIKDLYDKINPLHRNLAKESALHMAVKLDDNSALEVLLDVFGKGLDVKNIRDAENETPLHDAVKAGKPCS